jgi:hypothetical protein
MSPRLPPAFKAPPSGRLSTGSRPRARSRLAARAATGVAARAATGVASAVAVVAAATKSRWKKSSWKKGRWIALHRGLGPRSSHGTRPFTSSSRRAVYVRPPPRGGGALVCILRVRCLFRVGLALDIFFKTSLFVCVSFVLVSLYFRACACVGSQARRVMGRFDERARPRRLLFGARQLPLRPQVQLWSTLGITIGTQIF